MTNETFREDLIRKILDLSAEIARQEQALRDTRHELCELQARLKKHEQNATGGNHG